MESTQDQKPVLKEENVSTLRDEKFLKMYDYGYFPSSHYYVASRRRKEELIALKTKAEFQKMLPDAVSCIVILECAENQPHLFLTKEFRYPTGQYLLGVPAGLLDPEDAQEENAIFAAAKRELWEETGIAWTADDEITMVNPLLFSSPGMTDESNAIVLMRLRREKMPEFTSKGAVGGERFEDYELLDRDAARNVLENGVDADGIFYSVYTWIALISFVTGYWSDRKN